MRYLVSLGRAKGRRWRERDSPAGKQNATPGVGKTCVFPALPLGGAVAGQVIDLSALLSHSGCEIWRSC